MFYFIATLGWASITDALRLLPGPSIEITQLVDVGEKGEELSEAITR